MQVSNDNTILMGDWQRKHRETPPIERESRLKEDRVEKALVGVSLLAAINIVKSRAGND